MRPYQIKLGTLASLVIIMLFLITALSACGGDPADALPLEVDFKWQKMDRASGTNPEVRVSGVPEGTVSFFVGLTDLDLKSFNHGGGYVANDGTGVIKRGTIEGYFYGPDPPQGIVHSYEIKVEALDKDKKIIGLGRKVQKFPPQNQD